MLKVQHWILEILTEMCQSINAIFFLHGTLSQQNATDFELSLYTRTK